MKAVSTLLPLKPAAKVLHHTVAPFVLAVRPDQRLSTRIFSVVMLLTRLGLGGVLIYAGAVKVPEPAAFTDAIANFEILPHLGNQIVAYTLPWAEIVIGLLLICGLWLRVSAGMTVLMLLGFGGAVIFALARGLDIECGCFGTDDYARVGFSVLAIEAAMIIAGVFVFIFPKQSLSLLRLPKKVVAVVAERTRRVSVRIPKKKQA